MDPTAPQPSWEVPPAIPASDPPSPPLAPPVPVIEYDTPPRADHAMRRRYAVMLTIAALLGSIIAAVLVLRLVRRSAPAPAAVAFSALTPAPPPVTSGASGQQIADQRQLDELLGSSPMPDAVAYEEEPVAAARMISADGVVMASRSGMSQPTSGAFQPPIYKEAPYQPPGMEADGLLFAHALTSPGGNRRLVLLEIAVNLEPNNRSNGESDVKLVRKLKYRICEPKLFVNAPQVLRDGQSLAIVQSGGADVIPIRWVDGSLRSARAPERNLRIYAGVADAVDPSHFTIDYALGGKRNIIDGWLTDDDFLRIIPRGGSVNAGTWTIDAGAATGKP
ncbi:MAG TPA: hypothetical protein VER17_07885 [Tepidisphaeraceae bacterium]|nr:hypothetical protein [Tepidisphaeraceae bacterium]